MALNKKPMTQLQDRIALSTIDQLSKACLADIVVDLLRQSEGDERLDGEDFIKALIKAHGPIATARDEKPLKAWKSRASRAAALNECQGHESTDGPIGNVTYCDGSCR